MEDTVVIEQNFHGSTRDVTREIKEGSPITFSLIILVTIIWLLAVFSLREIEISRPQPSPARHLPIALLLIGPVFLIPAFIKTRPRKKVETINGEHWKTPLRFTRTGESWQIEMADLCFSGENPHAFDILKDTLSTTSKRYLRLRIKDAAGNTLTLSEEIAPILSNPAIQIKNCFNETTPVTRELNYMSPEMYPGTLSLIMQEMENASSVKNQR